MQKSLIIMLANGLEEVEFVLPYDMCHRAGIQITLVAVPESTDETAHSAENLIITGSHKLPVVADCTLSHFLRQYQEGGLVPDAVFLPGGLPGSIHLANNPDLTDFLQQYGRKLVAQQHYLAAICAAPAYVLGKACGLLQERQYTCYPGTESAVPKELQGQKQDAPLIEDRNVVTASGVGSAHLLARRLMELLVGSAKADEVMKAALFP